MLNYVKRLAVAAAMAGVFLCSVSQAQITAETSVRTAVVNATGFEKVGSILLIPEGETVTTARVGLLLYSGIDGYQLTFKASNKLREPVPFENVGQGAYIILGSGKVWADLTAVKIDFENQTFDIQNVESQLTIDNPDDGDDDEDEDEDDEDEDDEDDEDEDDDEPDLTIPEDRFDNIARRVDLWATGLPGRKVMAGHYKAAQTMVIDDLSMTINDIGQALADNLRGSPDFPDYREFFQKLDADLTARYEEELSLRGSLADYYEKISIGLEAGQ